MTRVIEADEAGQLMLPPELLSEIKPHTKYVVEAKGDGLVIYPEVPVMTEKPAKMTLEQWETQWREAQNQVSASWPKAVSATDIISEMRR